MVMERTATVEEAVDSLPSHPTEMKRLIIRPVDPQLATLGRAKKQK